MAVNPFKRTVAQIRTTRRNRSYSVGGVPGLAVNVTGVTETIRALSQLPVRAQRTVFRQALAAAARPVMRAMKAGAKAYERGSDEAIGTVGRSLTVKVATSKRDPTKAYALVGAKRGYAEIVRLNSAGKINSLRVRRRGKQVRPGVHKIKSRQLKNIGPIARKARLDPKKGMTQRRTATRYLHLIELGGKKRKIRAGHFMDNAARSASGESLAAFDRVLVAGIHREFSKMAAK